MKSELGSWDQTNRFRNLYVEEQRIESNRDNPEGKKILTGYTSPTKYRDLFKSASVLLAQGLIKLTEQTTAPRNRQCRQLSISKA